MVPELSIGAPEGARTGKCQNVGKGCTANFWSRRVYVFRFQGVPTLFDADSIVFEKLPARNSKNATFAEEKKLVPPVCRKDSGVDFHTTDMHGGVD